MEMDPGISGIAQMGVQGRLRQVLKQNRELVGVTVQEARIYGSSTNFVAAVLESREMLERFETRAIQGNDAVMESNIIAKPMSGKTHELGQRIGRGRFNAAFIRSCLESGKNVGTWGVNTTLVADGLREMKDHRGNPLVWHEDASEWEPEERARIAKGMYLTVLRAPEVLPRIHPEYDLNILNAEWLVALLDEKGVPQFEGISFNQFRLPDRQAIEDASKQRIAIRKNGERPREAYEKTGGEIDKDVPGSLLVRRVGSPESNARQEIIMIDKYRKALARFIERGIPEFGDEELAKDDFRDNVLLPEYCRILMDDWGVVEGLNGVIVPNRFVSGEKNRRRRYFAGLIETFKIDSKEFYDSSEILAVA